MDNSYNKRISVDDLEHILRYDIPLWKNLAEKNILITGGTGFFGKWILESLIYMNSKLLINTKIYVLSRNPKLFLSQYKQFDNEDINFITGDICDFSFPENVPLHYIIHAATEANVSINTEQPLLMFDTIVSGTKQVLELALKKNVMAVLHTSSGAVYGKQPQAITHITEKDTSCPDIYNKNVAYGEGKRVAEMLSNFYYHQYGVKSKIARCFAFVGPYLPLNTHFAIGNFLQDVLNNSEVVVQGDGSAYRSYLYAADLVIWLFTILINGEICEPYNVGSDEQITIGELAKQVASLNNCQIKIMQNPDINLPVQRYVPAINKAKNELGLKALVSLKKSLDKTYTFYHNNIVK